jgi:hypothetical protein
VLESSRNPFQCGCDAGILRCDVSTLGLEVLQP